MNILAAALLTLMMQSLSIQGTVFRKSGGEPLSKVTVELRGDQQSAEIIETITTEDDGRFLFENLRPGRYRLATSRRGYVRPPLTITLAPGQPLPDISLPMTPSGAIAGRIYDNNGQPMGNIEVQALKASYPEGRRVLVPVQSVVTNDLGEYRLFGLARGRYYVAALHARAQSMYRRMFNGGAFGMSVSGLGGNYFFVSAGNSDPALGGFEPEPESESDYYAPIFFVATTDAQSASGIDIRGGADFGGVNIVVGPVRARHVRGVVIDGSGKPAQYARITLPKDPEDPRANEAQVDPENGSFDVLLLPGLHTLNVSSAGGTGSVRITVGDADVENLTIVTRPAFDISGSISVEGRTGNNTDLANLRMTLRRDPPRDEPAASSYSTPLPNGAFTLAGAAGDFRINIAPILNLMPSRVPLTLPTALQDAYVKSIRLGNADVLNAGFHLERQPSSPLQIVIATNPGALDGEVVKEKPEPLGDIFVILVPDVRGRTELYRTVPTDSTGRFHLDRLPPGGYKVFAFEEVEDGDWYDPEFMRTYENRGTQVHIAEGAVERVRISVIP